MQDPLTDQELQEIEERIAKASPGHWESLIEDRDFSSGDSFIKIGEDDHQVDLYLTFDPKQSLPDNQDFIAHAHQDIPRLIEEIKRLKG